MQAITITKTDYAEFTRENYRNYLQLAKERFNFCSYFNFSEISNPIIWRHDVDVSPQAARKLAIIEAEEGIVSTYFWLLHGEFYNLLEKDVTNCVIDILSMGHNIGLHFDYQYYNSDNQESLIKHLELDRNILEAIFECKIEVFSFHNPNINTKKFNRNEYAGMLNVYSEYFSHKFTYCSDSNGYWRYRSLHDVLLDPNSLKLQVLTHPEWWTEIPLSPHQRIGRCIDGRANRQYKFYDEILQVSSRLNIK